MHPPLCNPSIVPLPALQNTRMAHFPRKVGGRYAMSDINSAIATVGVDALLDGMRHPEK
ncbi:MAG: hypothetical protein WBY88_04865 [Desulfosarcina sp.]